jgi:predicted nucleic acid-binding protein
VRALLDTSVLIGGEPPPDDVEAAISVASITELHFGVLVATDEDEPAHRVTRLAAVEETFDPLPVTVDVARMWGQLAAAVARRGGNPRRRQIDLGIAATAAVERVPLLTADVAELRSSRTWLTREACRANGHDRPALAIIRRYHRR